MKNLISKSYFVLLLLILTIAASAQDEIPEPKDGATYPVGTVLKAVCKPNLAHLKSTWTSFEAWDQKYADSGYDGWLKYTPSVNTRDCTARFMTPGKYRMVVVSGRFDKWEEVQIVGQFTIGKLTPCEGQSNQITSVHDSNGQELSNTQRKSMGLGENSFMQGQNVQVPKSISKGIEIEFADGSLMRIASGSQLRLNKCSDLDLPEDSLKVKISLLLGVIWMKITPAPDYTIQTDRAVCGNRGTIFSVEYNPTTKTTTIIVEEGEVWMRNLIGKVVTIDIKANQTGVQTGNQPPKLKGNSGN